MFTKSTFLKFLDDKKISYDLYQHDALSHGDIDIELPDMKGMILKNLVLTNKTRKLYMFTLPLTYRANLKALSNALGVPRFSFATVSDLAFMGIPPGHVSPFCLLNDIGNMVTYVQPEELDRFAMVNCHPLDNHFSVDITLSDLEKVVSMSGHEIIKVQGTVSTGE